MLPVKMSKTTGEKPGGTQDWKLQILAKLPRADDPCNWQPSSCLHDHIIPKQSGMRRGSRLTPERIKLLKVGEGIRLKKKEMLLEVLYTREAALIFEWSEIS